MNQNILPLFELKRTIRQRQGGLFFRLFTNTIRLTPDFIIIGTQKGGTSSLFRYLEQHPCVVPSFKKEIFYFNNHFKKGMDWYRAHFPSYIHWYYARMMRGHKFITGEATPDYLFHPHAPRRMAEVIAQVKLIVMLRNPVDRAYSHYQHIVRLGKETLAFEEALDKEDERLNGELEKMLEDENYISLNRARYSYKAKGIYVDQLQLWEKYFRKEQIMILTSENFYENPRENLEKILNFLCLPTWLPEQYKTYNAGNYPPMNAFLRERLINFFEPYNQRLYEHLDQDLGWESS